MIKVAFFDFGRTIAKGPGFGAGPIFMGRRDEYEKLYKQYTSKKIDEESFIMGVANLWNGLEEKNLPKVYSQIELNPNVKSVMKALKTMQVKLVLVSNIPLQLAELYKNLGFDYLSGTECETKNGVFTGQVVKLQPNKGAIVRNMCSKLGIGTNESIAVGDSRGDVKMFEVVGYNNSVAYNAPNEVQKYSKQYNDNKIQNI